MKNTTDTVFRHLHYLAMAESLDENVKRIVDALDKMNIDYRVEGVSLLSFLVENEPVPREELYWHYPHYHLTTPGSVIRDGDFKLIKNNKDNRLELYNFKNDIG